jgi:hypothetical protein
MSNQRKFKVGDYVMEKGSVREAVVILVDDTQLTSTFPYLVEYVEGGNRVFVAEREIEPIWPTSLYNKCHTFSKCHTFTLLPTSVDGQWLGDYDHSSRDEQKKKWKEEGRCEECGHLREMSIHGLLDCPYHPKPGGPQ